MVVHMLLELKVMTNPLQVIMQPQYMIPLPGLYHVPLVESEQHAMHIYMHTQVLACITFLNHCHSNLHHDALWAENCAHDGALYFTKSFTGDTSSGTFKARLTKVSGESVDF